MKKTKVNILFYLSVLSFFVSSATIWLIPFGAFHAEGGERVFAFVLAILFWLFLFAGFLLLHLVSRRRRLDLRFQSAKRFAFFCFFSNKAAIVFDSLLIVSFLVLLATFFIYALPAFVSLAGTFFTVFFLEMHGVFNGKNYEYLSLFT